MRRSSLTAIALALGICAPTFGAIQVTQNFDVDPAAEGWIGLNNRSAPQDYGFSTGDITGTDVNPPGGTATGGGEIGGTLTRQGGGVNDSFYGVPLGGELDISTDSFSVSGVIHAESQGGGSGFNIGYSRGVDSYGMGGDPLNFIGMFFDDATDGFTLLSTASGSRQRDQGAPNLVGAVTLPFSMNFDATTGTLEVDINGEIFSDTFGGDIEGVDPLTHFGIFPVSANGSSSIIWIDDLTYTAIAEVEPPDLTVHTWNQAGAGNYNAASNWDDFFLVPNSNTDTAVFGAAIESNSTVFTETPVSIKTMRFDNPNGYALAGTGSFTLDANTGSASVQVLQGNHQFQVPVTLADSTSVDVAAGSSMTFNNALNLGGQTLTKTGAGTLLVNNDLHTGSGSVAVQAGTLGGDGSIGGSVSNPTGTVAPGSSAGTLEIDGTYSQSAGGSLAIEIGGANAGQFDVLDVNSAATLAGTLSVSLIGGFTPAENAMFTVLTASAVTNNGLVLGGPAASMFSLITNSTSLVLQFGDGPGLVPGDYNGNGVVDAADYVLWREQDGDTVAAGTGADGDGNGTVNSADYTFWRGRFGNTSASGSGNAATAVPEPSAALLGLVGLVCWLVWFDRFGGRNMQPSPKAIRFSQFPRASVLAFLAWVLSSSFASAQFLKVEDFTEDPGWIGQDNFSGSNLFGWSGDPPTNFAGGEPGEIGGVLHTSTVGYFADDIGTIDPSVTPLQMAGKGVNQGGNGQHLLGWFDKDSDLDDATADPLHFVGAWTDDDRFRLFANGQTVDIARNGGAPFTFSIEFDPAANGGLGRLTGTVNGPNASGTATLDLPADLKDSWNDFDSFGMLPHVTGNDRTSTWYYDDLIYTTSITQPPITEIEWGLDSSRNLNANSNWTPGLAPDSNELTAVLGSAITAPRVLFTDTPITLKGIEFDNANKYTLAGWGNITMEADTGNAAITVAQGSHEFQTTISLADNLDVTVAAGATLSINNLLDLNGFTLTKSGAGSLLINNAIRRDGGSIINSGSGTLAILGTFIPEPSSMLLVMIAAGGMAIVRRRR